MYKKNNSFKTYLTSFYYTFRVNGVSLEYKGLRKNFDLIMIRFRKLKLNRKMPGIIERINPRTANFGTLVNNT